MIYLFLAELGFAIIIGIVGSVFVSRWKTWVERLSPYQYPYDKPKEYGRRSWVARSFLLTSPFNEVKSRLNALQEVTLDQLLAQKTAQTSMLHMASMLGKTSFPTGIEIRWLSDQKAELSARQYADWPRVLDDSVSLPLKQRQLTAERAILHIVPEDGCTRIYYELLVPNWVYVLLGMVVTFVIWAGWIMKQAVARFGSPDMMETWFVGTQIAYFALLAFLFSRTIQVMRFQSISLFDGVIGSLGELCQRQTEIDQRRMKE